MNLAPPWSDETPWGVSKRAEAFFSALYRALKEGELKAGVLDRAEVGELQARRLIDLRADPLRQDPRYNCWVVVITPRGRAALDGIAAIAKGDVAALAAAIERFRAAAGVLDGDDDARLTRIMELQARRRELEPEVRDARAAFAPTLAKAAKEWAA